MVSCNDNYPMGTWGGDPGAPWNQPDDEEDDVADDGYVEVRVGEWVRKEDADD